MLKMVNNKTLIFDLDNTIYDQSTNFLSKVRAKMNIFIQNKLDLSSSQASILREQYYHEDKTTLNGLIKHHKWIDPYEFLSFVHNVPLDDIKLNVKLCKYLSQAKQQKIIFTNSPEHHAKRILKHLQLDKLFDGILSIEKMDFIPKPAAITFKLLCENFSLNPNKSIYFEDLSENLLPAAKIGMTTVLVKTNCEKAMRFAEHKDVHHKVNTLSEFFEQYKEVSK